jgi:ankyrin repeat protein
MSERLHDACVLDDTAQVWRLITLEGADPNCSHEGATMLHWMAVHPDDNPTVARMLIEAGATVDAICAKVRGGTTPLHWAAEVGNVRIALALIKGGADINALADSTSPLRLAMVKKHTDVVELLSAVGADWDAGVRRSRPGRSSRRPLLAVLLVLIMVGAIVAVGVMNRAALPERLQALISRWLP